MPGDVATRTVALCSVPKTIGSRGLNIPDSVADDDFRARFDQQTYFYDAVRHGNSVRLFAPLFGDFAQHLNAARFTVGGTSARPKLTKKRPRYNEVSLKNVGDGPVAIALDEWTWASPPSVSERDVFADTNAVVLFNKNNALEWISDHLTFHKMHHGLNAAVIVDNGSDAYTQDELAQAVSAVGLQAARVLHVPAPWGSAGPKGYRNRSLFLQSACLNLVRYRFLRDARAVLICDIDELVMPRPDGRTIFDEAVRRWHGWVPFEGEYAYTAPDIDRLPRHADHIYRAATPVKPTKKYCVAMQRPVGAFGWKVHKPDVVSFDHIMRKDNYRLLHCQALHTAWKMPDRGTATQLVQDDDATRLLQATWP